MPFDLATAKPDTGGFDLSTAKPVSETGSRQPTAATGESGFLGNVSADLQRRYGNLKRLGQELPGVNPSFPLRAAGEVAGGMLDIGGEAFKSVVPDVAQKAIGGAIKLGAKALFTPTPGKRDIIADVTSMWNNLTPGAQKNIEAVGNIAAVLPVGGAASKGAELGTEGLNVGRDLLNLATRKTPDIIDKQISSVVKENLGKAIKVSSQGKQTWPLLEKYFNKGGTAVQEIITNKENLNMTNRVGDVVKNALPETRIQFAQAIHETKSKIFNEFNAKQIAAGKKGAIVDLNPVANELNAVINDKTLLADVDGRAIIEHAKLQQQYLLEAGTFIPEQAQQWIARANSKLSPAYAKGTFQDASRVGVDESIASMMRKQLDKVIEQTGEKGYQDLKNRYGALIEIERGTTKASSAALSKAKMPNFFDITSGTALLHGLLSMNPATIGGAGFMESLNIARRHFQNPDLYVKQMFQKTERLMIQREYAGKPFSAKSKLFATPQTQNLGEMQSGLDTIGEDISGIKELQAKQNATNKVIADMRDRLSPHQEAPTILKGKEPVSTIRSAVDYDRVILPSIMKHFKDKLPTWVEDRLQYLRTVTPSHWTADDWLTIRRLTADMESKKLPLKR